MPRGGVEIHPCHAGVEARQNQIGSQESQRDVLDAGAEGEDFDSRINATHSPGLHLNLRLAEVGGRHVLAALVWRFIDIRINQRQSPDLTRAGDL